MSLDEARNIADDCFCSAERRSAGMASAGWLCVLGLSEPAWADLGSLSLPDAAMDSFQPDGQVAPPSLLFSEVNSRQLLSSMIQPGCSRPHVHLMWASVDPCADMIAISPDGHQPQPDQLACHGQDKGLLSKNMCPAPLLERNNLDDTSTCRRQIVDTLMATCAVYLLPLGLQAGRDLLHKPPYCSCSCLPCLGAVLSLVGSAGVCHYHFPEVHVRSAFWFGSHAVMHVLVFLEYIWEWRFLVCKAVRARGEPRALQLQ